ncbi:DUF7933 domain-containing protein [Gilvimarinus sp. 1_MG-2023]|uniref:DUF7933 domain-containing protein n=1 Tax=Gilvimarinus sp. 1_MG-2023 TaxID=3062638 RepID=UPI0026E40537|nr:hypothetical protein [Gilvimarinus sp. 1_MG-2023]MDO6745617.1 hypothetical protein [Gilvimarinus sp. 1_MG-2023]
MKKLLWLTLLGCLFSVSASAQVSPTFSKTFVPEKIETSDTAVLTFTLDNSANATTALTVNFSDTLPPPMVVGAPSNASTNCVGGTLSAPDNGGSITYTGGAIPAGGICQIVVDIVAPSTEGLYVNTTSDLTSSFGNSGPASSTLEVIENVLFLPLPVDQDFESIPIQEVRSNDALLDIPGFRYEQNSPNGRFAIRSDFDPDGMRIASMDNPYGESLNHIILGFDGSAHPPGQELYLDFNWYDHGDEADIEDIVEIRGTPTDAWLQIYNFGANSNNGAWTSVTDRELTAVLNGNGQSLSNQSQIRFGQNDNFPINTDGISLDDIEIGPSVKFDKAFSPTLVALGDSARLTFSIDNRGTLDATGINFSDNLPAGMTLATPANVISTCIGNLTAANGTSLIDYSSGSLVSGASCTIEVDVVTSAPGDLINTSNALTSSAGDSGSALATLTVTTEPSFSKAFAPASVTTGTTSTLTFSLDNSANSVAATTVDFTDNLPAGLVVATPPNLTTTCTGGTLTAPAGSGSIGYSGGTISAASVCTIAVDVVASTLGELINLTGDLTSNLGNSGTASATLAVNDALGFGISFSPTRITSGQQSTMSFTIDNSGSIDTATDLEFSLPLPPGMEVASPINLIDDCGGALIVSGSTLDYSGGSVAAGASCSISLDVTAFIGSSFSPMTTLSSSLGNTSSVLLLGALGVNALPLPMLSNWSLGLLIIMVMASLFIRRRQFFG